MIVKLYGRPLYLSGGYITGYFRCLFQTISAIKICICFHSIFLRSLLVGQGEIFESCRICILFWQVSTGNWKLVCLAFERNHQINFSLLSHFILEKKQCLSVWANKPSVKMKLSIQISPQPESLLQTQFLAISASSGRELQEPWWPLATGQIFFIW